MPCRSLYSVLMLLDHTLYCTFEVFVVDWQCVYLLIHFVQCGLVAVYSSEDASHQLDRAAMVDQHSIDSRHTVRDMNEPGRLNTGYRVRGGMSIMRCYLFVQLQ